MKLRYIRKKDYYDETDETKNKEEKKIMGKIRERARIRKLSNYFILKNVKIINKKIKNKFFLDLFFVDIVFFYIISIIIFFTNFI